MSENPWDGFGQVPWNGEQTPDVPGTPSGVAQVAPEIEANKAAAASGQTLNPWDAVDFTSASSSWFSGRNVEGPENGWDSPFWRTSIDQEDKALEAAAAAGDSKLFWDRFTDPALNRNATGVVTWTDERTGVKAGDVYENGEFKHNLFIKYGDRDAATMLAPLLFNGTEQARLFEQGTTESNQPLMDAVNGELARRSEMAYKQVGAEAFRDLTAEKKEMLDEGVNVLGSITAGAGGGAAVGATGFAAGPLVGAITTIGGAIVGGIGGFLNRDQFLEQSSRTLAQAEIAGSTQGSWQAAMAHLSGWSSVGMLSTQPLSNTVQGLYDARNGWEGVGDGASDFYATDPTTGERKAPGWVEAVNLVATVGDAFGQFASGPGRALYFASMSGTVGAGVGQVLTDDIFDPTAGQYREFQNGWERTAAWGSVGIDALQMSVARGLTRVGANQRAYTGMAGDQLATSALARATNRARGGAAEVGSWVDRTSDKIWAGVRGRTLPKDYTSRDLNGMRFFFGEDKLRPVEYRLLSQAVVPSEFTKYIPTTALARVRKGIDKGVPTADDVYQVAAGMYRSGRLFSNAVFNAQAEAWEEAAQAFLDPQAYGESATGEEIRRAALMGFASGMGMTLGASYKGPTSAKRAEVAARRVFEASQGGQVADDEWRKVADAMGPEWVNVWSNIAIDEAEQWAEWGAMLRDLHNTETGVTNLMGFYAVDAMQTAQEQQLSNNALPASGGTMVLRPRTAKHTIVNGQVESAFESNEGAVSLWRLGWLINMKLDAQEVNAQEARSRLEEFRLERDAATPERQAEIDAIVAEIQQDLVGMESVFAALSNMGAALDANLEMFRTSDATMRNDIVDTLNSTIRNMARGLKADGTAASSPSEAEAFKVAVELFASRYPLQDRGSFVRIVPQVSLAASEQGEDGVLYAGQTMLGALNADFDGDFSKLLNFAYIPPHKRREYRLGLQYFATVDGVDEVVIDAPDADATILDQFRVEYLNPAGERAQLIEQELDKLADWLHTRYDPVLGVKPVTEAIAEFRADVRAGVPKARMNLATTLAYTNLQRFIRMGDQDSSPEIGRLLERITLAFEQASSAVAHWDHTKLDFDQNLTPEQVATQRAQMSGLGQVKAATHGAALAYGVSTPDAQRAGQQVHYLQLLKTAIALGNKVDLDAVLTDQVLRYAKTLQTLVSGKTQTASEEVAATDVVFDRVRKALLEVARQSRSLIDPDGRRGLNDQQLAILIGQLQVSAFDTFTNEDGSTGIAVEDGTISFLQLLLRQSVKQEEQRLTPPNGKPPTDRPEWMALQKTKRLTYAGEIKSYTASAALVEVYGAKRLSELLDEDEAALLGPDTELGLFVRHLTSKHEEYGRKELLEKITSRAPATRKGVGDPPYTVQDVLDKEVNVFTIVVNSIKAVAQNHDKALAERDKSMMKTGSSLFDSIKNYIQDKTPYVKERRLAQGLPDIELTPADVLADLLEWDADFAEQLVKLIPVDALPAVFSRDPETGQVNGAKWINEALLAPPARGLFMFWVHPKLDHLRLLHQGVEDLSNMSPVMSAATAAASSGVRLDQLNSRFHQLVMMALYTSQSNGGLTMLDLERAIATSESLPAFMSYINENMSLRGDRAPLLAWYDDTAEFETLPNEMFHRALPSARLREQWKAAATRLEQLAADASARTVVEVEDIQLKRSMLARVRDDMAGVYDETRTPQSLNLAPSKDSTDFYLGLLWRQLKMAGLFPDGVGPTARDNALAAVQEGVQHTADKGTGDPNIAPVGEILPVSTGAGLKQGLSMEIDNISVFDLDDVLSNPSMLAEGPTLIAMPEDGARVLVDLSTMIGVLEAWNNPATEGLVNAVVFPVQRDLTATGTTQMYSVFDASKGITNLLKQSTYAQFVRDDGELLDRDDSMALLSLIESLVYKQSESLPADSTEERQDGVLSVHVALQDFLTAYAAGPRASKMSDEEIRHLTMRRFAQALMDIAQLDSDERVIARDAMTFAMMRQYTDAKALIDLMSLSPSEHELLEARLQASDVNVLAPMIQETARLVQEWANDPNRLPEELDMLQARLDRLEDKKRPLLDRLVDADLATGLAMLRARRSYAFDWNDPAAALDTAKRILERLGRNTQLMHFRNSKEMRLNELAMDLSTTLANGGAIALEDIGDPSGRGQKPGKPSVMQERWEMLGEWAARSYLMESVGSPGGTFGVTARVDAVANAYFDPLWGNLIDYLFDEKLLGAAKTIADISRRNNGGAAEHNIANVTKRVMSGLFDPRLIAEWDPLYPQLAMKARHALLVSPVGAAVAQSGTNPTDMFDPIGAGQISVLLPDQAAHETKLEMLDVPAVKSVAAWMAENDPDLPMKLEHHFVRSIKITDSQGLIPAQWADLTASVGRLGLTRDVVPSSPYYVLELKRLQERLDKLISELGLTDYSLTIEYVDIDKKPYSREYANNMWFEGVGAGYETNFADSLVSSLIFATKAVNKIGQQITLDYSKKPGSGYLPYVMSPRQTRTELEEKPTVLAAVRAKVRHLAGRRYETGLIEDGDINALMKIVLARTLVRRTDAAGVERLMWAEEAIALDHAEVQAQLVAGIAPDAIQITPFELVALSEQESNALLGGSSPSGRSGLYRDRLLNPADMDPFPEITPELLEQLNLTRLGEMHSAANSSLGRVRVLPKTRLLKLDQVDAASEPVHLRKISNAHREAKLQRSQTLNFEARKINEEHKALLYQMLQRDRGLSKLLAGSLAKASSDQVDSMKTMIVAQQLDALLESPDNVIWLHSAGNTTMMMQGRVTAADIQSDFGWADEGSTLRIVRGDVFILDLGLLYEENRQSMEAAYEAGRQIIEGLTSRGVKVVLQSSTGPLHRLRSDFTRILEDELDYQKVDNSPHIFEPITTRNFQSANERARERSLVETRVFTARGAQLGLVTNHESVNNEGGGFARTDMLYDHARDVVVQLPSHLTRIGPGKDNVEYTFGLVMNRRGAENQYTEFSEVMLPILSDPNAAASLGLTDPPGVPILSTTVTPDGVTITTPGILSSEEAIAELRGLMETGSSLYEGRTLRPGALIPYIDRSGHVILQRYGFELPTDAQIQKSLSSAPVSYPGAPKPMRIVVATGMLEKMQTIPPDFTIKKLFFTAKGIRALGDARLDKNAKYVLQMQGVKLALTEMPDHFNLVSHRLSRYENNDVAVSLIYGQVSSADKGGILYLSDNFSDAAAIFGFNAEPYLREFFGPNISWNAIKTLLDAWSQQETGMDAFDILQLLQTGAFFSAFRDEIHGIFGAENDLDVDMLFPSASPVLYDDRPAARITQVVMAALLVPGVRAHHVLGSVGLINVEDNRDSLISVVRPPNLMAMAFDDKQRYPNTFAEIQRHMQSHIAEVPGKGAPFVILPNWKIQYQVEGLNGKLEAYTGSLQYILPVPAEQNEATYIQRFIMNRSDNVSPGTGVLISAALGGRVADRPLGRDKATGELKDDGPRKRTTLSKWGAGELLPAMGERDSMYSIFGDVAPWVTPSDPAFNRWGALNYAEYWTLQQGQAAARLYSIPVDYDHPGWGDSAPDHATYLTQTNVLMGLLGLEANADNRRWIEIMVRQMLGRPGPSKDQPADIGYISLESALQAVNDMIENVREGFMPTMGGVVPLLHADMLRLLYMANQGENRRWSPMVSMSKSGRGPRAEGDFESWVKAAIGQLTWHTGSFSSMYVPALNGFWQSYNGATPLSENLTVSFEVAQALGLRNTRLDGSTRDSLAFSHVLDQNLSTPIFTDNMHRNLDGALGRMQTYGRGAEDTYVSTTALYQRARASWRAKKKMVKQDPEQTLVDFEANGARYMENNNAFNVAFRNITMWSLINRMLNPGIFISALLEIPFRRSTEYFTNLVTGTSLGRTGARLAEGAPAALEYKYTPEEVSLIEQMIKFLGDSDLFMEEVQQQISYAVIGPGTRVQPGRGRFTQGTERLAAGVTSWMADPWHGMRGDSVAREYIYAVLEYLNQNPNAITISQLVEQVTQNDPLWIKKNFPKSGFNPHSFGMNRVAQTRAMKLTMLSRVIANGINGLTTRPSAGANIAGHLLRIPFMFQVFQFNAITTMTGMSGWDQTLALFGSGRRKPKFLRSKANRALGDAAPVERFDFSDVIETLDLQRTFIRSNITVSMLATLAMAAGNLGLDGEDEEAKRRARLAKYLNVPIINDPYEPQNSFKYADAIFVDSIPFLDTVFKDERGEAAFVPHWVMRQFTSPILGLQRFLDTGDLREIGWGFQDAFSVMPYSITRLWNDADATAGMLADQAAAEAKFDSAEARGTVNQLVVNIARTYEKALLENSFINALYTGNDPYDRNPYAVPLVNPETGDVQIDPATGAPLPTTVTRNTLDEAGNPVTVYEKRSPEDAATHAYTENNLGWAIVQSLFTGQLGTDSSYLRQNMVIKERTVGLPETSPEVAKALLVAQWELGGGAFTLSKEETIRLLKANDEKAGIRWDQANIEERADALIAAHGQLALSIGTEEGEFLTTEGGKAVYRSIMKGAIPLGHPSLAGIAIPWEMRNQISQELADEVRQDAIDLGLSAESAEYLVRRFWYGDKTNPEQPGLQYIINSDKIPTKPEAQYNQLNVLYAIGPDGRPWATPFQRGNVLQTLGIPLPHLVAPAGPGTHIDNLGNVVDDVLGINTGLSGVVRKANPPVKEPEFKETTKVGDNAGGTRFGRGSSGGSGGMYFPPFIRMDDLPFGTSARNIGIPMVNTNNPYIRRANVNRERVFGERGRLKQWQ